MPARTTNHGQKGGQKQSLAAKVDMAPQIEEFATPGANSIQQDVVSNTLKTIFNADDRAKFYTGRDRLDLQAAQVQRVRELQEENDHLQREINARELELLESKDPLIILADIEHRRTIIARNTGEILNIYTRNEERLKKMGQLEAENNKIKEEMRSMQNRFINTNNMDEKTKFASDYFILRSNVERNAQELKELSKN
ncbi:MAG TPA: hypothetical protein VLG76_04365 [Rhabdochlamydiaceae bacterium]|nr:hypothetical protein [Rhabdochlamydiaceae bacterium]